MKFKTTVVGERGQIVIPKEIREALKLKPGAQVIIMHHGGKGPAIILPASHIKDMMQKMTRKFAIIQKSIT